MINKGEILAFISQHHIIIIIWLLATCLFQYFEDENSNAPRDAKLWRKFIYYGLSPIYIFIFLPLILGFKMYNYAEAIGNQIIITFRLDFWIRWYFVKGYRKTIDRMYHSRAKMIWGSTIQNGLEKTLKGYFTKKVWLLVDKQYELNGKPNENNYIEVTSKY